MDLTCYACQNKGHMKNSQACKKPKKDKDKPDKSKQPGRYTARQVIDSVVEDSTDSEASIG